MAYQADEYDGLADADRFDDDQRTIIGTMGIAGFVPSVAFSGGSYMDPLHMCLCDAMGLFIAFDANDAEGNDVVLLPYETNWWHVMRAVERYYLHRSTTDDPTRDLIRMFWPQHSTVPLSTYFGTDGLGVH